MSERLAGLESFQKKRKAVVTKHYNYFCVPPTTESVSLLLLNYFCHTSQSYCKYEVFVPDGSQPLAMEFIGSKLCVHFLKT